jgi:hypothetical protein
MATTCLIDVAPPLKLPKPLRIWRGVQMKKGEHPADAAFGVSWTRSRDVACWFVFRFDWQPDVRPFVFRVDLDPRSVIAIHRARREREVLVNVEELNYHHIVLDGSKMTIDDLMPDSNAADHLIERWRRGCEQERQRRRKRDAKRLERYKGRVQRTQA